MVIILSTRNSTLYQTKTAGLRNINHPSTNLRIKVDLSPTRRVLKTWKRHVVIAKRMGRPEPRLSALSRKTGGRVLIKSHTTSAGFLFIALSPRKCSGEADQYPSTLTNKPAN